MPMNVEILSKFRANGRVVVFPGDCLQMLAGIPDRSIKLVVTSPPYNIGKEYEQRLDLTHYVEQQAAVIRECFRVLRDDGSICWQVGNYVDEGAIVPLDVLLGASRN